MSFPILYTANTTDFSSNGVGMLSDAVSCVVSEERNGAYTLEMEYPVDGIHYSEIITDCIIRAKANQKSGPQLFRVVKISAPLSGAVTVSANHIRYQMASIPVSPCSATTCAASLEAIRSHAAVDCPFTFWTDKDTVADWKTSVPCDMSGLLGGQDGSIIDTYGGEWEFDNYAVKLWKSRGGDTGVKILYGKNLTDLTQEKAIESLFTGIYPYWADSDGHLVQLTEKVITLTSSQSYHRIRAVDFSDKFENEPTEAQLRSAATNYINANGLTSPTVSITVNFSPIWQTDEYKSDPLYQQIAGMEKLGLCDTVTVYYSKLGVNCKAKITSYEYDSILERYNELHVGDAKSTLSDTIAESKSSVDLLSSTYRALVGTDIATATKGLQSLLTGAVGGHIRINFGSDGYLAEIIVMDTEDKNTCVNCLRINLGGIGFSTSGYNGPFNAAIGLDGALAAQWASTWKLTANIIQAGILEDVTGEKFYMDLDGGTFSLGAGAITYDGQQLTIRTAAGYTFGDDGLIIDRANSSTKTAVDETGVEVDDKSGAASERLFYAGVENGKATVETQFIDVSTYIKIGTNSRIQDYTSGRTGIFYIGS